jgi:hypothetical protein
MAIYDWVAQNIWYDLDVYNRRVPNCDRTASNVLAVRRTVCEGYANLMIAFCRAIGIPAKRVSGYARGNEEWPYDIDNIATNHAWCEVYVNGYWMIADPTWDSGNVWEYGKTMDNDGLRGHRYFDAALESFSSDHYIKDYDESGIEKAIRYLQREANPFQGTITVNGIGVEVCAYNIDGYNYVKLRDVAAVLNLYKAGIIVNWDNQRQSVIIITGSTQNSRTLVGEKSEHPQIAVIPAIHILVNDRAVYLRAYSIQENTYFKLRDLAELFGFEVGYNAKSNEVTLKYSD